MNRLIQDVAELQVRELLAGLRTLPSLGQRLEHEIGARMRRANIHLNTCGEETQEPLSWLTSVCLRTFAAQRAAVWILDEDTGKPRVHVFRPDDLAFPAPVNPGVREMVAEATRSRTGMLPSPSGHGTAMATPMTLGEHLIGAVHVEAGEYEFGDDDLGTFSLLVEVFALGCFLAMHTGSRGRTPVFTPRPSPLGSLMDLKKAA